MTNFTFSTTRTIINEAGAARRLATICEEQGARSVMLVTDEGIIGVDKRQRSAAVSARWLALSELQSEQ